LLNFINDGKRKGCAEVLKDVENRRKTCWITAFYSFASPQRYGKSGKNYPSFDILALAIYSPLRVPGRNGSRRTKPACLKENSAWANIDPL